MSKDDFDDDSFEDEFDFNEGEETFESAEVETATPTTSNTQSAAKPSGKSSNQMLMIGGGAVLVVVISAFVLMSQNSGKAQQIRPVPKSQAAASLPNKKAPTTRPTLPGQNTQATPTLPGQTTQVALPQSTAPIPTAHGKSLPTTANNNTDNDMFTPPALNQDNPGLLGKLAETIEQQGEQPTVAPTPRPPLFDEQAKEELTHMSKEINSNEENINNIHKNLDDIANTLAMVNQSINAMDHRVLNLTETVDNLSNELGKMKKFIAEEDLDIANSQTARVSREPDAVFTAPEYVVHAIIPGRAWLKTPEGQIITVTEGDAISDYGKIAAIDSANGLVVTSSGISFR